MKDLVTFDEFKKLDLVVGMIEKVEIPEESESLIKLRVYFGEDGKKTIFAGIKKWYSPEELEGKKTIFVLNLEPKNTPFGMSEGMLLAVDGEDRPELMNIPGEVLEGSRLR